MAASDGGDVDDSFDQGQAGGFAEVGAELAVRFLRREQIRGHGLQPDSCPASHFYNTNDTDKYNMFQHVSDSAVTYIQMRSVRK